MHEYHLLPKATEQHALAAGALGCIMIGVMARVSLSHAGSSIDANRITITLFGLITLY